MCIYVFNSFSVYHWMFFCQTKFPVHPRTSFSSFFSEVLIKFHKALYTCPCLSIGLSKSWSLKRLFSSAGSSNFLFCWMLYWRDCEAYSLIAFLGILSYFKRVRAFSNLLQYVSLSSLNHLIILHLYWAFLRANQRNVI